MCSQATSNNILSRNSWTNMKLITEDCYRKAYWHKAEVQRMILTCNYKVFTWMKEGVLADGSLFFFNLGLD